MKSQAGGLPVLVTGTSRGIGHGIASRLLREGRTVVGMSRHVATGRGRPHLLNVGNVLGDGCRRDKKLVAERRFHAPAIEMPFGTIALNAAGGPRMASVLVANTGLFNREGEFAVGSCRDRSRLVVAHSLMITQLAAPLAGQAGQLGIAAPLVEMLLTSAQQKKSPALLVRG